MNVKSIELRQGDILIDVENLGHATTRNATLVQMTDSGEVLWESTNFTVNATSVTSENIGPYWGETVQDGEWFLRYQKRVIDSSKWVTESVESDRILVEVDSSGFLPHPGFATTLMALLFSGLIRKKMSQDI